MKSLNTLYNWYKYVMSTTSDCPTYLGDTMQKLVNRTAKAYGISPRKLFKDKAQWEFYKKNKKSKVWPKSVGMSKEELELAEADPITTLQFKCNEVD